jgi:hypothetical protein
VGPIPIHSEPTWSSPSSPAADPDAWRTQARPAYRTPDRPKLPSSGPSVAERGLGYRHDQQSLASGTFRSVLPSRIGTLLGISSGMRAPRAALRRSTHRDPVRDIGMPARPVRVDHDRHASEAPKGCVAWGLRRCRLRTGRDRSRSWCRLRLWCAQAVRLRDSESWWSDLRSWTFGWIVTGPAQPSRRWRSVGL